MGNLSSLALLGRIGDAVIERFRDGAVEFLVAADDPARLRLTVRFAGARDRTADLARLRELAASAGAAITRGWTTPSLVAVELPIEAPARPAPADRVVAFSNERRRPRLASRI